MRTLGQRVYQIDPPGGFAAQASAGAVIWASTKYGYPLSTTHVVSGAVMGSGATKRLSAVRWGVAGNIVVAWVLTIPAAALVAAACYWPVRGDLLMRLGLGSGSGEMFSLFAQAGENARRDRADGRAAVPRVPVGSVSQERREGARARRRPDRLGPDPLGRGAVRHALRPGGHRHARVRGRRGSRQDRERLGAARPLRRRVADPPVARALRPARPGDRRAREAARAAEGPARLGRRRSSTIKAIEDEADRVARAARAGLFKDDRIDPGIVIRWKGIYEALEDAVDACETAAHRVGNILVKNA